MTDDRFLYTPDAKFSVAPAGDGKPPTLSGYAMVWNVVSKDRGGYGVKLLPGSATFAKDTLAIYQHSLPVVLGNTANNTLRITPDEYGAKVEIDLPNTTDAHNVAELVGNGYVRGMSFAMTQKPTGKFSYEGGRKVLTADPFTVYEVTITPKPAFEETSIGVKQFSDLRFEESVKLERFKLDLYRLPGAVSSRTAV